MATAERRYTPREDALKYAISLFEVRKGRRVVEFTKEKVLVGRDTKECDLVLDPLDLSASRIHLAMEKRGDAFYLENLSKNGTAVNGALVGRSGRRLYHGDLIEAGNAELTFMLTSEAETAVALFEEGKRSEQLDPSYAAQCYALAHRQCPSEVKYAAALLRILEQEGRIEELVTGGGLFDPDTVAKLARWPAVAAPIARAFVRMGEFARAQEVIEQSDGADSDDGLRAVAKDIERLTGGELLKTVIQRGVEVPFFQRNGLRVYIEAREDIPDLRFVERYHKYLQQRVDPLFGGPPSSDVTFHVSANDRLFAESLPDQTVILGYYSPDSGRIFVRPRRWIESKTARHEFHVILVHEYVHLRVDGVRGDMLVPRWFNEGLAQVLSEDRAPEAFRALGPLREKCRSALSFPDSDFSPASGVARMAYLQSHAILLHLVREYGKAKVVSVLTAMSQTGAGFRRSLEVTLGTALDDVDKKWWSLLHEVRE